jgi:hypothetical protein
MTVSSRSAVPRRRVTGRGWFVFLGFPAMLIGGLLLLASTRPRVTLDGVEEGKTYGASTLPSQVVLAFDRPVNSVHIFVNGAAVPVAVSGLEARATLGPLPDGAQRVVAEVDRGALAAPVRIERSFVVDTTAPSVEVLEPLDPVPPAGPVTVRLRTDDPAASVSINGQAVEPDARGIYSFGFDSPPDEPVPVVLVDPHGNSVEQSVAVNLALPGLPGGPPIRGVHASGYTWASPVLKDPIMEMIHDGLINTVEVDLKDENGEIWYDTSVPLAHEIGAVSELWDLTAVVDELHRLGIRVIGRLVVYRDPKLAGHAVETGRMDWVVQNPDGTAFGQYGGYTNPFNREVWEYNMAIAEEAARLGVDDILYDYVRRPDQFLERMRFPGQGDETAEDVIVAFLEESRIRIHAAGARLGASVFGIAATRPDEIAQDIPRMAAHLDYVAPMVYPSHWGPGEYGVANPNAAPYDITYLSLVDFRQQVQGSGATVVAWLQDFSLGVEYGPSEVRAQIEAANAAGVLEFLLWDAATTYTRAALLP